MVKLRKDATKDSKAPISLIYVGDITQEPSLITLTQYDKEDSQVIHISSVDEILSFINESNESITWININGVHNKEIITKIGKIFKFSDRLLEEIMNVNEYPKIEFYTNFIYATVKMLYTQPNSQEIIKEHVSLILGPNYVISFQERPGDVFDEIRNLIKDGKSRICESKADYLFYSLLDSIVDNYFKILEIYDEKLDTLEEILLKNPRESFIEDIHKIKRNLVFFRRIVWPLREVMNMLSNSATPLIQKENKVVFHEIYDHVMQAMDSIEIYREIISETLDIYLSSINYRLNDVMKVLTVISTIFIPLSFIASLYGMNFKYMPELYIDGAYHVLLVVMGTIFVGFIIFFRRKHWI